MREETKERLLALPDKFCLYSGMRNPSREDEIAWQQFDTYPTKQRAIGVMRKQHAQYGGLWMIVRETPMHAMLPDARDFNT